MKVDGRPDPTKSPGVPPAPIATLLGPHVAVVLVVMHATLADCPGGGFETEADQAKCDGSVRSIPVEVLSTEILAPLTGVCWRFGMKKLHVRRPSTDVVPDTLSVVAGTDPNWVFCSWAARLLPGPPQLGGQAGATPCYSSWPWLLVAALKLF